LRHITKIKKANTGMLQNPFNESEAGLPGVGTRRMTFKKASLAFHHLPTRNDKPSVPNRHIACTAEISA
jgi:hypothetical protein